MFVVGIPRSAISYPSLVSPLHPLAPRPNHPLPSRCYHRQFSHMRDLLRVSSLLSHTLPRRYRRHRLGDFRDVLWPHLHDQ
jgi:hypothetical protein